MIDKNESFYPVHKIQQMESDAYCIGVAFYRAGRCVARQACVMPVEAWKEVNELSFRSRCSITEAAATIDDYVNVEKTLGDTDPRTLTALAALSAALKRGKLVLGSDLLVGNECNREDFYRETVQA